MKCPCCQSDGEHRRIQYRDPGDDDQGPEWLECERCGCEWRPDSVKSLWVPVGEGLPEGDHYRLLVDCEKYSYGFADYIDGRWSVPWPVTRWMPVPPLHETP